MFFIKIEVSFGNAHMFAESTLRKILDLLNSIDSFEKFPELLELFDQMVDLNGNDEDFFLIPEESNLQLPEIFLKDTELEEYQDSIRNSEKEVFSEIYEKNCFEVLEFLETVELEDYEMPEKEKAPEIDMNLLRKLTNMHF